MIGEQPNSISRKVQPPVAYNATLVERIDLTDKLAIFRIAPDPLGDDQVATVIPDFEAGQYIVIGANNEEHPEKGSVRRAYSIASPPTEKRFLEFYVRYVEKPASDNPLTHLLWKMKDGDRLHLGPKIVGKFTLSHTIGRDDTRWKIFVAAGTGLAPFVAIAKTYFNTTEHNGDNPLEKMVILHGASQPQDLGYREELDAIFNSVCSRYLPTISRPHLAPDWSGRRGRVETFFDAEELETLEQRLQMKSGEISPQNCVIYVCGLQDTIAKTITRLLNRGFIPNDKHIRDVLGIPPETAASLFFEQYDSSPILDLKNDTLVEELRQLYRPKS